MFSDEPGLDKIPQQLAGLRLFNGCKSFCTVSLSAAPQGMGRISSSRQHITSSPLSDDPIRAELSPDRLAIDAENIRGLRDVATSGSQHAACVPALDFLK